MPNVRTELHDLDFPHIREVDRRLIETAGPSAAPSSRTITT
jgi:hypothetical protein